VVSEEETEISLRASRAQGCLAKLLRSASSQGKLSQEGKKSAGKREDRIPEREEREHRKEAQTSKRRPPRKSSLLGPYAGSTDYGPGEKGQRTYSIQKSAHTSNSFPERSPMPAL